MRNGDEGADVKELQSLLLQLNYNLGRWGADGDFGDATEMAVREFQKDKGIEVDGIAGKETIEALLGNAPEDIIPTGEKVRIVGGNCYVRTGPSKAYNNFGVAKRNETFTYLKEKSEDGWHKILFEEREGWVSGKYSEVIN